MIAHRSLTIEDMVVFGMALGDAAELAADTEETTSEG